MARKTANAAVRCRARADFWDWAGGGNSRRPQRRGRRAELSGLDMTERHGQRVRPHQRVSGVFNSCPAVARTHKLHLLFFPRARSRPTQAFTFARGIAAARETSCWAAASRNHAGVLPQALSAVLHVQRGEY